VLVELFLAHLHHSLRDCGGVDNPGKRYVGDRVEEVNEQLLFTKGMVDCVLDISVSDAPCSVVLVISFNQHSAMFYSLTISAKNILGCKVGIKRHINPLAISALFWNVIHEPLSIAMFT
jgi:hypothetical protein